MFKFEMTIGWLGNGKVTVETGDFDVIVELKKFIEFQEDKGWCGGWDAIEFGIEDEAEVELGAEETISGQTVQ